jgi:ElaB/YqjD/DUF883 family membrane-anchored ribosome-binding protein
MASDNLSGGTPSTSNGPSASQKLAEGAAQFKDKAAQVGRSAANQIDSSRGTAAGSIASAATSLHDHADDLPGGERVASLAHSAADKLTSTADYIRGHDMDAMIEDIKTLVKNNPGPALLGAAAIGFLVGKAFSNRD